MAIIDLGGPDHEILETVKNSTIIKCDLLTLNAYGKQRVRFFIEEVLRHYGELSYLDDLFLSVMELSFNALKANYAYMIVLDRIRRMLNYKQDQIDLNSIWKSQYMMRMYTNFIGHPATREQVRSIIRGEGNIFKIMEKAALEGRPLTAAEEERILRDRGQVNGELKEMIKATLNMSLSPGRVIIDVINDAPITQAGLDRIHGKRTTFREYYDSGRIAEFYMENLDDTESAGFGAAMIDSRLLGWGLDPWQHFKVLTLNKKTCANLTIVFN